MSVILKETLDLQVGPYVRVCAFRYHRESQPGVQGK